MSGKQYGVETIGCGKDANEVTSKGAPLGAQPPAHCGHVGIAGLVW